MRKNSGVHSFELVAGLIFLVPVVLYAINYAVVLYAGAMNSSCCTAAARAAASGPPTSYASSSNPSNTPAARATAVLTKMSQTTGVIREHTAVDVAENISSPVPTYGSSGFGGALIGNVTIKTRCDVYPPFALPFIPSYVSLYTTQTYPWTWVMPTDYTPVSSPSTSSPYSAVNTMGTPIN